MVENATFLIGPRRRNGSEGSSVAVLLGVSPHGICERFAWRMRVDPLAERDWADEAQLSCEWSPERSIAAR